MDLVVILALVAQERKAFRLPPLLASLARGSKHISTAVLVGTTLMVLGTLRRMYAYRMLGPLYTFHLSIKKEHKLITTGPYAVVRHPAYASSYPFLLGGWIATVGPGSIYDELGLWDYTIGWVVGLLLTASLFYVALGATLRTVREDKALKAEFGEQWDAWAARTPYRVLPFIF